MSVTPLRLFVGSHAQMVRGSPVDLGGDRCFTPVYAPPRFVGRAGLRILLDSGAFSDPPDHRPSPEAALQRQRRWEERASNLWGFPVIAEALVSHDLLIDETWASGHRCKRRWTLAAAEAAVCQTVAAAAYLVTQRAALAPRALVLACQGVDAIQYTECAQGVLAHACPGDWLGLGGWCLLGRAQRLLPEFFATCRAVLPLAQGTGLRHVHLFGVLWLPALGGLLWLADQHGLSVSCDSAAPVLACTRGDPRKAGCRAPTWQGNVAWWQQALADLRRSSHYREPPRPSSRGLWDS